MRTSANDELGTLAENNPLTGYEPKMLLWMSSMEMTMDMTLPVKESPDSMASARFAEHSVQLWEKCQDGLSGMCNSADSERNVEEKCAKSPTSRIKKGDRASARC